MIIKLLVDGGEMKPGPAIAQKIGPLGINMGKVISEVNEKTSEFKGTKVPVELDVNPKTKSFSIKVFSPPTAELLKKEFKVELGSADHKKIKVGNASIEEIIKITKIKFPNMLAKDLKAAVKSILGTCASIGILIENKEAKEILKEIESGKFDNEIKSEKTELSAEKRKELDEYFKSVKEAQERRIKEEQKAAEEAAAAKAAAEVAAGKPAAAAEPGKEAVPGEEKKAEIPAKPEAKLEKKPEKKPEKK